MRIQRSLDAAKLSQRSLAKKTGIAQSILSRIISGERIAKVPELLAVAEATGTTFAELSGVSSVADRALYAARATNGAEMDLMREELLHYLELDAYLDDQAIPRS
jgi:transcriptional regulator with XRE-family HTH domain